MKKIYFDNNATTPLYPDLSPVAMECLSLWGNPSSVHWAGQQVKGRLREARQNFAQFVGAHSLEVIFTSGGSESNSIIISLYQKIAQAQILGSKHDLQLMSGDLSLFHGRSEFITTTVEHPSIKRSFEYLETQGYTVHWIKVDREGQFDWSHFCSVLSEKTLLVSVMAANNETGVILPLAKITKLAHEKGAFVHSDCVQALGKMELDLQSLEVDYASFSAHKFYALKGVGALYVKKGSPFHPLIWGGGQERHRRGGTENTLGICLMGKMAQNYLNKDLYNEKLSQVEVLRNYFEAEILRIIPNVEINHQNALRLGNTSSVILSDVEGEALLMALDVQGMAVSTGSACSSGASQPSATLRSFGLSHQEARSTLRVSFGWLNTIEEVDLFLRTLSEVVIRLRKLVIPSTLSKRDSKRPGEMKTSIGFYENGVKSEGGVNV